MITNYANRVHEVVNVKVTRAWRHGLINGQVYPMPMPEADRAVKMGMAEIVTTQRRKRKSSHADESV